MFQSLIDYVKDDPRNMFSIFKRSTRKELSLDQIVEIELEALKHLKGKDDEKMKQFIQYEGTLPDSVKITLYDFIIEFNKLDYCMDKFYRLSNNKEFRSVASHKKALNGSMQNLYNNNLIEDLLKKIDQFSVEDIRKKLVTIQNSIWVRDRIAHGVPFWLNQYDVVVFISYDGVFWHKTYTEARLLKNTLYIDDYYRKENLTKELSHHSVSYVLKHIHYLKKLFIWMKNLREIIEIENSKF